jgi:dihydroorotase
MTNELTITCPDDWHLHLRAGEALTCTVPHAAKQFNRAIIMPNLMPPVTTIELALEYRKAILEALPAEQAFNPLMALYLTNSTSKEEVQRVAENEQTIGFKLYPAGATTNSDSGVADIKKIYSVLAEMERQEVPLLVHGEVTDSEIDIFDREKVFIDRHLKPITEAFPALRVILEHVTTKEAVEFVSEAPKTVAATITAHHLLFNRNSLLAGGIRPHYYCLPILKREKHREALIKAAISGNPKFFLGTDSAPHASIEKESSCGCAGCYTAYAALELYTMAFDAANSLDKLEGFASHFGADFYRLPRNKGLVTLKRASWEAPSGFSFATGKVIPLMAGKKLLWKLS